MPAFLAPLAIQAGGALLGGLLGSRQSKAEARRQRAYRANLMRVASPQYLMQLQQQLYNQALSGPAYEAARRGVFNAATNTTNRLAGSLAARGLSNSGVGSISNALAGSAMAGQLGGLRTGLYGAAGSQAGQLQANELGALQAMGAEPSYNYGSQALAGSLGDISKTLMSYIPERKPKQVDDYSDQPWMGKY